MKCWQGYGKTAPWTVPVGMQHGAATVKRSHDSPSRNQARQLLVTNSRLFSVSHILTGLKVQLFCKLLEITNLNILFLDTTQTH